MKKFLLVLLVVLSAGCSSIRVELPTGEKATYSRLGNQHIDIVFEKTEQGALKASLQQQSELTVLTELAKAVNKLSGLQ